MSKPSDDSVTTFESLGDTLRAARKLATDLADEPLFARLVKVFQAMPAEDRATVIDAMERDVYARLLSRATEKVTGQAARPNPHARLYVRSHGPEMRREDLEQTEMTQATLRAIRVMPFLMIPEIYAEWQRATHDAVARTTPEERALVQKLVEDVLGMLAEASTPA